MLGTIGDLIEANRATPEERAMRAAERFTAQVEREQRELFGETAEERAARERLEKLEELHALYGLCLHQRDEVLELADRNVVGQDRDHVGDAALEGAQNGQRVASQKQGRSLDPMRVEENGARVKAGVEGQEGRAVVADASAAIGNQGAGGVVDGKG